MHDNPCSGDFPEPEAATRHIDAVDIAIAPGPKRTWTTDGLLRPNSNPRGVVDNAQRIELYRIEYGVGLPYLPSTENSPKLCSEELRQRFAIRHSDMPRLGSRIQSCVDNRSAVRTYEIPEHALPGRPIGRGLGREPLRNRLRTHGRSG